MTTADQIISKVRRLSPVQAKALRLRLNAMTAERKRADAEAAVKAFVARQRNAPRDQQTEQESEAPAEEQQVTTTRRGSGMTWHGTELERQD